MSPTGTDTLPSVPNIERGATATRHSFSPTSSMRFVCAGGEGLPDFFEEESAEGDGPPLHRHPWPSWELVLEGSIRVVADGEEHVLSAGDTLYLPGGVAHSYVVESPMARIVGITLSDGRFARLQREAEPLLLGEGPPDVDAVGVLAAAHGTEILGPPLGAPTAES